MPTPEPEIMNIDAFNSAIDRLGQLGIGALVIVCVMMGIVAFIIYHRVGAKSKEAAALLAIRTEENETKRTEETAKIFTTFATLFDQTATNRDTATAQALRAASADTNAAIKEFTASNDSGNIFRAEQVKASLEVKEEIQGLRGDLLTNQSAFDGKMDGLNTSVLTLINAFGRQEDMLLRLLKFVENNPVEHAAVKEALDMNTAAVHKLLALMTPANDDSGKKAA